MYREYKSLVLVTRRSYIRFFSYKSDFLIFLVFQLHVKVNKLQNNGESNLKIRKFLKTLEVSAIAKSLSLFLIKFESSNDEYHSDSVQVITWSRPRSWPRYLRTTATSRSLTKVNPSRLTLRLQSLILRSGDVETHPGPRDPLGTNPGTLEQDVATTRLKPCLQVLTYNVRGLSDSKKVRHLINHCHRQCSKAKDSIFMFQETFVDRLDILDYIWRGEYHLTSGTGHGLGCITLVSSPFKIIHRANLENRAHVLVLTKNNVNSADLIIANVYAPNGVQNDKLDFFEMLIQKILELKTSYNCENVIIAGDLNLIFNSSELKNRAYSRAEQRMAEVVKQMFNTAELVDGWDNVTNKEFTWTSNRNGSQMFSTLDRIFFSESKLKLKEKVVDWSLSLSDHAMVKATFEDKKTNQQRCNLIPRLDSRMLDDRDACEMLKIEFEQLMEDASPDWDPHVALEYCKMAMRTAAFTTTGNIKARLRDDEKMLNADINEVINELTLITEPSDRANLLANKLDDLKQLKRVLIKKIGTRIEVRNARTWHNEGELSNKYFFNLLNRKTNDEIDSVLIDNEPCTDRERIETEIRTFYKDLYENLERDDQIDPNNDFFRNIEPVDQGSEEELGRAITLEELTETLKTCADSAPGPDGIPYSFLKFFWHIFGPILTAAWNHSLAVNNLPPSHKVSYLRLIPKAGKDQRIISNLRPITLSNTDHKLVTKTYARKLTKIVSDKICQEQTAYLPGRLINDNIRSMLMTMDLANCDETVDGVIVSLDARKAFDSVDHDYIRKTLTAFGLNSFIGIFNVLYKDLKSNIILNGTVIDGYRILKGVKQGDALSCILFIMCMEPLIRNIKTNVNIESISSTKLNINLPKVYGYADDVNALVRTNLTSIQNLFSEYEKFTESSGLLLNADKTEILRFKKGNRVETEFNVSYRGNNYLLKSQPEIKVNGILFLQDPKTREERNVEKIIGAMTKHLEKWSRKYLTVMGKILILKTYAVSQAIFLMQSMLLNENSLKKINQLMFKFLWNKNFFNAKAPDRIKRSIMLTPVQLGGFGMMNIDLMNKSLNLKAIGRMVQSEHPVFKQIWADVREKCYFNVTTKLSVDDKLKEGLKLLNSKRADVLAWPVEKVCANLNLVSLVMGTKLSEALTVNGKRSIPAFRILIRRPETTVTDLTAVELASIERHLINPQLATLVRRLNVALPPNVNVDLHKDLVPTKNLELIRLSVLSSKSIREDFIKEDESLICVYKCGMLLTPGEVLNWTGKVRKLTSTKHKCAIMRTAHGDVYTNDKLFRFGLINDPKCNNCQEPLELLTHRLIDCPNAQETWAYLENYIDQIGLDPLSELTMENILGAGNETFSKVAFTMRAELVSRLMTKGGKAYHPLELVRASLKTILNVERLEKQLAEKLTELLG